MLASRFAGYSPALTSSTPITDDQLRQVVPSIFAPVPHSSRSANYSYIPTVEVLDGLRTQGFQPFFACQTRTRDEGKRETTKHMLRLRHPDAVGVAGTVGEIILLNSHDGTSSYQLLAGMFRFVCKNGLICGDAVGEIRVHHKGNVKDQVIDGAFEVLDTLQVAQERREEMQALPLTPRAQEVFAEAALALRYDEDKAPIAPQALLAPRRYDDNDPTLWGTFNRVQENLIRGGIAGRNSAARRTRTREVKSIDQNVRLNRGLWVLAERMAELAV